jgi:hypothetical protein
MNLKQDYKCLNCNSSLVESYVTGNVRYFFFLDALCGLLALDPGFLFVVAQCLFDSILGQ